MPVSAWAAFRPGKTAAHHLPGPPDLKVHNLNMTACQLDSTMTTIPWKPIPQAVRYVTTQPRTITRGTHPDAVMITTLLIIA